MSTWTLTFEQSKKAAGKRVRKTVTVEARTMVHAIVTGRVAIHQEGGGDLEWNPIEAKCG